MAVYVDDSSIPPNDSGYQADQRQPGEPLWQFSQRHAADLKLDDAEPQAVSGAEQATAWATAAAREHKQAGRLALAARLQPRLPPRRPRTRGPLARQRAEALLAAAKLRSLDESQAVRLAVAGIGPDDAGLHALHTWKAQVADSEASR